MGNSNQLSNDIQNRLLIFSNIILSMWLWRKMIQLAARLTSLVFILKIGFKFRFVLRRHIYKSRNDKIMAMLILSNQLQFLRNTIFCFKEGKKVKFHLSMEFEFVNFFRAKKSNDFHVMKTQCKRERKFKTILSSKSNKTTYI